MSDVDFLPASDPLLRDARLDYTLELPVLGLRARFESNSRHVIETVDRSFGRWRILHDVFALDLSRAPLRVRIVVFEGEDARHVAPDATRVIAFSGQSFGVSDPERCESTLYVSRAFAADREAFRASLLEGMTLALLAHFDRHPLHAAAVGRNGRVLLLYGESGTGKSTLAHLAHGAGFDTLSEDSIWVQLDPKTRIWGWPGYARLLLDGNAKTSVPIANTERPSSYFADESAVCLLQRGPVAKLERIDSSAIEQALTTSLAPGFDRFPERQRVVARMLSHDGGWRLSLTDDPTEALPLLEQALRQR